MAFFIDRFLGQFPGSRCCNGRPLANFILQRSTRVFAVLIIAAQPVSAAVTTTEVQVSASADDAEEAAGVVDAGSSDLELTIDHGVSQTIGMRFTNVDVPNAEIISRAYLQFQTDEASSGATTLTIQGEAVTNAAAFSPVANNISARSRTGASVTWSPEPWPDIGAAGINQRSTDISAVIQELVNQPGWAAGNALVLIISGDGAAKRVAESFDGDAAAAPILHIEYGATPGNQAPAADAGADRRLVLAGPTGACLMPVDTICLQGSASDDGTTPELNVNWQQPGSPAADLAAPDSTETTAVFPQPGVYRLQLAVDDGELSALDEMTVTAGREIHVPGDAATIQGGVDLAADGDIVLVAPGVYQETVFVADKTITLASHYYLTGDPAFINTTEIDGGGADVIVQFDYSVGPETTITGFHVRNGNDGILMNAPINVLYNRVTETFDALEYKNDTGGIARGNLLELNNDDGIDLNRDTSLLAERNLIRDNNGDGIEMRMNPYTGPPLTVIFRDNVIINNSNDGIQLIDYDGYSDRSIYIEGNLILNNEQAGIGIMGGGVTDENYEGGSALEAIYVINNTIIGNDHGLTGGDNLVAKNNIFMGQSDIAVKNTDGNSNVSSNLFWNNGTDIVASNVDMESSVFAAPLLNADYHPMPGSPAIDAGVDAGFPFNGLAPDLGAYETPVNSVPAVDAGADIVKAWSSAAVALNGSVQDDSLPPVPGAVTVKWSQVSGACGVEFADENSAATTATFPEPGSYTLRLTADDGLETVIDEVTVCNNQCHP
jgi:hypothetical protein